jgi:hypothetical protein
LVSGEAPYSDDTTMILCRFPMWIAALFYGACTEETFHVARSCNRKPIATSDSAKSTLEPGRKAPCPKTSP